MIAWRRVGGRPVKEAGFEAHAVFGHAGAHACAVEGAQHEALCGEATELSVVPAGPLAAHRTFLGSEKVHAHVRGEVTTAAQAHSDNRMLTMKVRSARVAARARESEPLCRTPLINCICSSS